MPEGWDANFNSRAIEVVDETLLPIFQLAYKSEDCIVVRGMFDSPYDSSHAEFDVENMRRIFKYPSWKYEGARRGENLR
jgi:hypothetical protein